MNATMPNNEQQMNQLSRTETKRKRSTGLLICLFAIAALVFAMLAWSLDGSAVWSTTVDGFLENPNNVGKRVRLEGTLVNGTLVKRDAPCEYRFMLRASPKALQVRYPQCVIPDSFRDIPDASVKVSVEGVLSNDGVFEATQLLAKCPSKYEQR